MLSQSTSGCRRAELNLEWNRSMSSAALLIAAAAVHSCCIVTAERPELGSPSTRSSAPRSSAAVMRRPDSWPARRQVAA